jgi:hypothetical protein
MQAMYADWPGKSRLDLNLPDNYPTNPQAEVLALNGVPRKYIVGILTLNEVVRQELMAKHIGVEILANAGYFRYRRDFAHWKA